jgi:hypothetical protein
MRDALHLLISALLADHSEADPLRRRWNGHELIFLAQSPPLAFHGREPSAPI